MLIGNSLNVAIGATFFIFGQILRTFYPVLEQLFQHFLEQSIYAYTCHPKHLQKHATLSIPHGETLIFSVIFIDY